MGELFILLGEKLILEREVFVFSVELLEADIFLVAADDLVAGLHFFIEYELWLNKMFKILLCLVT